MKQTASILALALLSLVSPAMSAQDDTKPKLTVRPTGRLLIDGAVYCSPQKSLFKDGVALPDVRLGAKATYGKWSAAVDVGFAYNKVGLKDVYIQYNFNPANFLRGGSFIHQYGLQAGTGSSMKCTMEEPTSNAVFNAPRQIGAMYVHSGERYYGTFSAHVEPQAVVLTPTQTGQQGYGLLTRQVYRPFHTDGFILQAGVSGGFLTPHTGGEGKAHDVFSFSSRFPTSVARETALDATVTNAMNQWKFTPELTIARGPVALEAQYFYNRVNLRDHMHNFTGQGAYVTLRGLLNGGRYGYDMANCTLATPDPKKLEMTLMYNYTTLTDRHAQYLDDEGTLCSGIYGGRTNSLSATLNYYINKYFLVRLNYTYTHRWDAASIPDVTLNTVQARIQVIF